MKRVLLKLTLLIFIFVTFLFVFSPSGLLRAQEEPPTEINSFELFWPIVAGKTMGDPLYPLKSLKETVRGWLIFGKPQKADYAVFLTTKRVVEAEKLINEGKSDLANKTLNKAISQLEKAEKSLDALPEGISLGDIAHGINDRLGNLETFIPWLSFQSKDLEPKLQEVLEKVEILDQKV